MEQIPMRSKTVLGMLLVALSVSADKVHELFNAHRDQILSAGVSTIDGNVYLVGKANSPRKLGDAVGWTKAEEYAKWNIGDRHKATAVWPPDVAETEKDAAWLEYRAMHPNRFHVVGLQRIWTQKAPPDGYVVVMSAPAEFLELSPPTTQELAVAVSRMREKKRLAEEATKRAAADAARKAAAEEAARKAAAEAAERKAGARKVLDGNTVRQQQLDEDLVL